MAAWSFLEQRKTSRSTLFQMTLATVLMVPVLGDCGPPPSLPFASPINQLYKTIFPTGTVLKYTCFHGFKKVNTSHLTCDVNGLWMYSNFCVKKRCRNPGELVNGRVEIMTDIFLGSTIEFSCSNGCHARAPPEISNGKHSGRNEDIYTYGSSVTYNCDPGFTLLGNDSLTCTVVNKTIGVWSPSPPTCGSAFFGASLEINCHQPQIPKGHLVSGFQQSYYYRDSVEIRCKKGYVLRGSSLIYCESNGEWYPSVPTCEPSGCIGSPEIPYALWEGNKLPLRDFEIFEIGTNLKYQCKPGYRPVLNEAQFVTCQENLSWSPSKGCEKICCPIPYMENIRIVSERRDFSGVCIYAYRDYIFYICNEDTYPVPIDRRSLCEADGKWYPEIPSCHAAESSKDIFARGMCSKPVIMHGILSVEKDHYIETENVTIHCDTGYYLVGSSTIFCSENKTWLPEIPNCKVMSVLTQGTSVMSPLHLEGLDHCRLVNEGRKLLQCLSSPEDVRRALQVYKLSLEIKILEQETEKWARAYKKTFEHLKMKRLFRPFG